jgi:hypothetical protein
VINKDSDELSYDPEYQELEKRAFELYEKERELMAGIGRLDSMGHEARLACV